MSEGKMTPEIAENSQSVGPTRRGFLKRVFAATFGGAVAWAVGVGIQTSNEKTASEIDDMEKDIHQKSLARKTAELGQPKFVPPPNLPQNEATMRAIYQPKTPTPETSPTPTPPILTGK